MRRRHLAALGTGAVATAAAAAVATTAVVGTSLAILAAPPLAAPRLAEAAATELTPFADCEGLRQWYVDAALPRVGPWGLDGFPYYERDLFFATADRAAQVEGTLKAAAPAAVENGETGTNVQEAGVDEPDTAKTDGDLVAHLRRGTLVLTDVSGDAPRELAELTLPKGMSGEEILLVGDRVVVLGQTWERYASKAGDGAGRILPYPQGTDATRVLVVDIADPSTPRITDDTRYDGSLTSGRQYGDVVRLVLNDPTPRLAFTRPGRNRTNAEAARENRSIVRGSSIEDWLPRAGSGTASEPLLGCADVSHPEKGSGYGTVSIVSFDPASPEARESSAVTATTDLVYSSTDRLYVASSAQTWWWGGPMPLVGFRGDLPRGGGRVVRPEPPSTEVHAFALDGLGTEYVGSGEVDGWVRDRWSFSEYDGHLRVATALGRDSWNPRENGVVVLAEGDGALTEVGRVDQMGIDEQIQSVRWFGDVAVVVTFRQVDPLYTLDLSDPTAPRVVGELKIPGFSSYLHPLGGDLLLGLGQDADRRGTTRGGQAAVFDLEDLARTRRVDTEQFRPHTEFTAALDPRGFTYLPEQRTVLAPFQDMWTGRTRLSVLHVGEDGTLSRTSTRLVGGWGAGSVRTLPLDAGRVALVAKGDVSLLAPGDPS